VWLLLGYSLSRSHPGFLAYRGRTLCPLFCCGGGGGLESSVCLHLRFQCLAETPSQLVDRRQGVFHPIFGVLLMLGPTGVYCGLSIFLAGPHCGLYFILAGLNFDSHLFLSSIRY
jgi:hypothetical protein